MVGAATCCAVLLPGQLPGRGLRWGLVVVSIGVSQLAQSPACTAVEQPSSAHMAVVGRRPWPPRLLLLLALQGKSRK